MSDTTAQNVRYCFANVAERDERTPEALLIQEDKSMDLKKK